MQILLMAYAFNNCYLRLLCAVNDMLILRDSEAQDPVRIQFYRFVVGHGLLKLYKILNGITKIP